MGPLFLKIRIHLIVRKSNECLLTKYNTIENERISTMKNNIYAIVERVIYFAFSLIVTASIAVSVSQSFQLV